MQEKERKKEYPRKLFDKHGLTLYPTVYVLKCNDAIVFSLYTHNVF